ncbi:MAG: CU044_2847 family protein [Caldilineaceae bacterium]
MSIYATEHQVNDQTIVIQIEMDEASKPDPYEDVRGPLDTARQVIHTARDVFGEGMQLAHNCAASVVNSINQMPTKVRPTEFEVQFTVKLDSQVGAIIAKMGTEAQLQINMKWIHKETPHA